MSVNVRIRNGMAVSGGTGGASEGDIRGDLSDMIESGGVVDLKAGHLLVHQSASPDMNVVVDSGIGYIPNASFDETDSDQIRVWEAVVAGTTGSRTLAIGANSSGSTRIDLVCLKMDPGTVPDSTASNVASLIVVAGTPGAAQPATPSNYLLLAVVTVANGASSITNGVITDSRTQVKFDRKFITLRRVRSVTSASSLTPNIDDEDMIKVTALATGMTINAPSGTPSNGDTILFRFKDNGTARALTWNSIYRVIGTYLPSSTVVGKTTYSGAMYNAEDTKWDVLFTQQEG